MSFPVKPRRGSMRRLVSLACQAVRERDFRLVADQALDVSPEGMLLAIKTPVLTGESLIVSFPIPGTWIDAEATVTRVLHGRRPEDEGLAIGISFEVISPSSRAALAGFLHGRPLAQRVARRGRRGRVPSDVDVLGVLRAMAGAWQGLAHAANDAPKL